MSKYGGLFWSLFSCIRTKYGYLLCKSPYLVRISVFIRIQENTDQKKLHIRTLFTQCSCLRVGIKKGFKAKHEKTRYTRSWHLYCKIILNWKQRITFLAPINLVLLKPFLKMSQCRKEDVDLMNEYLTQRHNVWIVAQNMKWNVIQNKPTDADLHFLFQKRILNFPKNK